MQIENITNYKKFQERKKSAMKISEMVAELADIRDLESLANKSAKIKHCGEFLSFRKYQDKVKLHKANFCKDRICPMCQWRKSLKVFGQVTKVVQEYHENYAHFKPILLTLTIRNCAREELNDTINQLFKAFKKFMEYKAIKEVSNAYFRTLEITHNIKDKTFHPHFHIMLMVDKKYFSDRYYLSNREISLMWQKALNIDYIPVTDIRRIKDLGGVAEVSKYAVKDIEACTHDLDTLESIINNLRNRRLTAFGGEFKKLHKLLNLEDIEKSSLLDDNDNDIDDTEVYEEILLRFNFGLKMYEVIDLNNDK